MMTQKILATDLVRELIVLFGHCPMSARRVHNLILDGRIRAVRGSNGRFEIDRQDLPMIGETLGLTEHVAA